MAASEQSPVNVTQHLKGLSFPATKEDLEKHAKEHGADEAVMETLRGMSEESYETMADVMKAYGRERRS